jgi:hypothetical protein
MDLKGVIQSQYLAALEMLKGAVIKCPDHLWNDPGHKNKFWHIAYHALFYTHLYLQAEEKKFQPWHKHRNEYQFMGQVPWPPHNPPKIAEGYTRDEILEYSQLCVQEVLTQVPQLDLDSNSGFDWLPFGKLELQLYNIRHIQLHAGELCERLGSEANIDVPWVGRGVD